MPLPHLTSLAAGEDEPESGVLALQLALRLGMVVGLNHSRIEWIR